MKREQEISGQVMVEALEERRLMSSDGLSTTLLLSENTLAATADSSGVKQPGVYKSSDGGSSWSNVMLP